MPEELSRSRRETPGNRLRRVPAQLVIFDCDGVLVDTEAVANRFLVRILAEHGYAVTYEESRRRFVGRTIEAVQDMVEREAGFLLGHDWPTRVRIGVEREFRKGVRPIPGAKAAIMALRERDVPYCVASSGRFSKMRISLGKAGLLPFVEEVLFSAEQVREGKPAPDLFLHAAAAMGMDPDSAVVIEDSVPGVEAGVAAGMRVLGYAGDSFARHEDMERAGAELFHDMEALPELV